MPEPAVPGTLAEALAQLQGHLPRVAKTNPGQAGAAKYLYADLTDVSEAILPLMAKLGLSFTACPTIWTDQFVLAYQLLHTGGEAVSGWYPLPANGSPQQIGAAITYARRYTLCAVTGLAPGGDDDDAQSAERAHQEAAQLPRTGTNADLRGQGRMDRQQKAEHERLAADTVRQPQRAERSHPRAPDPDDPWTADAPVDHERAAQLRGAALTDPEDKPGTSTLAQQQAIAMELAGKGFGTRELKLAYCGDIAGRDIGSSKELSYSEAAAVLREAGKLEAVNA